MGWTSLNWVDETSGSRSPIGRSKPWLRVRSASRRPLSTVDSIASSECPIAASCPWLSRSAPSALHPPVRRDGSRPSSDLGPAGDRVIGRHEDGAMPGLRSVYPLLVASGPCTIGGSRASVVAPMRSGRHAGAGGRRIALSHPRFGRGLHNVPCSRVVQPMLRTLHARPHFLTYGFSLPRSESALRMSATSVRAV